MWERSAISKVTDRTRKLEPKGHKRNEDKMKRWGARPLKPSCRGKRAFQGTSSCVFNTMLE